MTYSLKIERRAANYLRRLDDEARIRILSRIDDILQNPFGLNTKELKGHQGVRSARVGGWRIIYVVEEGYSLTVRAVGPRGEIYRGV